MSAKKKWLPITNFRLRFFRMTDHPFLNGSYEEKILSNDFLLAMKKTSSELKQRVVKNL